MFILSQIKGGIIMAQIPYTTLFLLQSVDGKISTGIGSDMLDIDKNFPTIAGLKEGLYQYYDEEQETDLWSLNSGKVMEKMGVNVNPFPDKTVVNFVVIDNTHLNEHGVEHFAHRSKLCVIVTSNLHHPAFKVKNNYDNIKIIFMHNFNARLMLERLYALGCDRLTIQTGGTLNSIFVREKLIDYVNIVVAPVLIGGSDTPSLVDGESIINLSDLSKLGVLKLDEVKKLKYNYLQLKYKFIK